MIKTIMMRSKQPSIAALCPDGCTPDEANLEWSEHLSVGGEKERASFATNFVTGCDNDMHSYSPFMHVPRCTTHCAYAMQCTLHTMSCVIQHIPSSLHWMIYFLLIICITIQCWWWLPLYAYCCCTLYSTDSIEHSPAACRQLVTDSSRPSRMAHVACRSSRHL